VGDWYVLVSLVHFLEGKCMSLDVWLRHDYGDVDIASVLTATTQRSRIFIRDNGSTREITEEE